MIASSTANTQESNMRLRRSTLEANAERFPVMIESNGAMRNGPLVTHRDEHPRVQWKRRVDEDPEGGGH
jgi:hypothetical protein